MYLDNANSHFLVVMGDNSAVRGAKIEEIQNFS